MQLKVNVIVKFVKYNTILFKQDTDHNCQIYQVQHNTYESMYIRLNRDLVTSNRKPGLHRNKILSTLIHYKKALEKYTKSTQFAV
jgi:hypothetical protein